MYSEHCFANFHKAWLIVPIAECRNQLLYSSRISLCIIHCFVSRCIFSSRWYPSKTSQQNCM